MNHDDIISCEEDDYSMYDLALETTQSNIIKILFEVIKDVILTDINIIFTPTYIKIEEEGTKDVCMVYLELDTDKFEKYYCRNSSIIVGINAFDFYKVIKTTKGVDTISFFIEKGNNKTFIVKLENSEKEKVTESHINRIDVEYNPLGIPEIEYPEPIIMMSGDFQKIVRDMNTLGVNKNIEITRVGRQIIFSYTGDFSKNKLVFFKNKPNEKFPIISGNFDLKYLMLFIKATNLSTHIKIYLNNDSALILQYEVGTLGSIKLILRYE